MSNYHILTADKYGNSYRVVFHVPVAAVNCGFNGWREENI